MSEGTYTIVILSTVALYFIEPTFRGMVDDYFIIPLEYWFKNMRMNLEADAGSNIYPLQEGFPRPNERWGPDYTPGQ